LNFFKDIINYYNQQLNNDLARGYAGHRRGVPEIRGVHSRGRAGHPWQGDGGHGQPVRVLFGVTRPLEVQQIATDTI